MSLSPRRLWLVPVANVLISASMFLSSGACYRAPSGAPQPAVAEPAGERQALTREQGRLRRFPGIDLVPMARGAFSIRIHSGLIGDGEPLYMIDGAPLMLPPNGGIDWFTPEDISQIKVLKDPSELAVYGPRGVNGVIVITTKQAPARHRDEIK